MVLPFWYLLTRVVPDIFQKSSKTVVCVCVCVCVCVLCYMMIDPIGILCFTHVQLT